jgi:cellobiose phosphorylase
MAHARLQDGDGAYKLFSMMNPINISATYKGAMKYEQEPYVLAGDIYSREPNSGKGGWSWYTGAAGWMYQALMSDLLGIRRKGSRLSIDPAIPGDWSEYTVDYHFGAARYMITIKNPDNLNSGCRSLYLDDIKQAENSFDLVDDGKEHSVVAWLGLPEDSELLSGNSAIL